MAWIARDGNGDLNIFDEEPIRAVNSYKRYCFWKKASPDLSRIELPKDADERLLGIRLEWENEAIEL